MARREKEGENEIEFGTLKSLSQTLRAAYERAAAFVEPIRTMNVAGDADPDADADFARAPNRVSKPQFTGRAQIHPVIPFVDLHGLREAPRSAREIEQASRAATPLHEADALQRFDRANQDPRAHARFFARDVHHER
jgi:hypothetical protein